MGRIYCLNPAIRCGAEAEQSIYLNLFSIVFNHQLIKHHTFL